MRSNKQKCSSPAVNNLPFDFDYADCNLEDEVLSEGIKVQTSIWSERLLKNMENFQARIRENSINLHNKVQIKEPILAKHFISSCEERKEIADCQSLYRFELTNSTSKLNQEIVDESNSKSNLSSRYTLKMRFEECLEL